MTHHANKCRLHCKSSYENWDVWSNNVDQNTLYISLQNTLWWFYHFVLSFSLFKSWSVSTPWRREACAEPRDHRPQQPPDGGQAHHWEAPRRQCKNSFSCVAAENKMKRVTSSFVSSVVNEDPALNIKVQAIVAVGIILSYGSLVSNYNICGVNVRLSLLLSSAIFGGGREASAQQR